MILDLDSQTALEVELVGSKAASLAKARRTGLPVLPGFVVTAAASRSHLELGARILPIRGSGGARLAMVNKQVDFAGELLRRARRLSNTLVARSSSLLEASGQWAGAFASYVGVSPEELPKAVSGCWASAFTVAALERQDAAGVEPGSFEIAVLVQPFFEARVGGTAELSPDGSLVVRVVEGSPAPLLQGWATGLVAQASPNGRWVGDQVIALAGSNVLDRIRDCLLRAYETMGSNHCEWATDKDTWILQLDTFSRPCKQPPVPDADIPPELLTVVRALVSAPGPLGESLVLPWALSGASIPDVDPARDVDLARTLRRFAELTSQVWDMLPDEAVAESRCLIAKLKGPKPSKAVEGIRNLHLPNQDTVVQLMGDIGALQEAMVEAGAAPDTSAAWHLSVGDVRAVLDGGRRKVPERVGTQSWESLLTTAVLAHGMRHQGTPAAPGFGGGPPLRANNPGRAPLTHRSIVTAALPFPSLAQILWDAAGAVIRDGSPSAHLFESARSLGIPAVCGVDLPDDEPQIIAVDGYSGIVATLPVSGLNLKSSYR